MSRAAISTALVFVLLCGQTARANPWLEVARFFGEYFLGKAIDEIWDTATGKPDIRELDARLASYEFALTKVDARLSEQIGRLRRELDTKVTREQVRQIVLDTLRELEERIKKLEGRVGKLEDRVREIEEAFGYLPTVPPSPLLRTTVDEGAPAAHPLTVEWAKLIAQCETSRVKVEQLSRELTEQNAEMIAARTADAAVLQQIPKLHDRVKNEMAKLLVGRQELLKIYRPAHRNVRLHDDRMASMAWLLGVTRPVADGKHKGRLPVPKDLVGPRCSDILATFEMARADVSALAPLFRQLLTLPIEPLAGAAPLPLTPEMHPIFS